MSICGDIFTLLLSMLSSFWAQIIFPLYSHIGAVPFVLTAFILNLVSIYFLGRFIQADGNSDGVRKSSKRKSGGEE